MDIRTQCQWDRAGRVAYSIMDVRDGTAGFAYRPLSLWLQSSVTPRS